MNEIEELKERMKKVEENRPNDDAVALAASLTTDLKNTDKVLMDQSVKLVKLGKFVMDKMDNNPKDGRISYKEWKDSKLTLKIVSIVLIGMMLSPIIDMLIGWYNYGSFDWMQVLSSISMLGSLFVFSFGWKVVSNTKSYEINELRNDNKSLSEALAKEKTEHSNDKQKAELDKKAEENKHLNEIHQRDLAIEIKTQEINLLKEYGVNMVKKLDS